MARWRTVTVDTMTGTPVAEIVLANLTFTETLNDVGNASGTLTLPSLTAPFPTSTAGLP